MEGYSRMLLLLLTIHYGSTVPTPLDQLTLNINLKHNNGPGKEYGFGYRKGYGGKYGKGTWKGKYGGYGKGSEKGSRKGKYGGCGKGYGGGYGKGYRGQTKSTQNCECGRVNGIPDAKYVPTLNYTGCNDMHTRHALKDTRHTSPEISGGGHAIPNQYPFMAQFVIQYSNSTHTKESFCGGTLISNKHIITAAHCGNDPTFEGAHLLLNSSYIFLGSHFHFSKASEEASEESSEEASEKPSEREYDIKDIKYPHGVKCYSSVPCEHDIAIIVLKTTVEFTKNISPICLPQPNEKMDHKLKMISIGWGLHCNVFIYNILNNIYDEELKHVQVELIDINSFDRAVFHFNNLTNFLIAHDSIIAGKSQGFRYGDSGGPLIQQIKVNDLLHYKLIGVISGGTKMTRFNTTHDTYAAINPFVRWIEQTVASEPGSCICKTRI